MYLVAATICFLFSTLYHIFSTHSLAGLWQLADHLGIVAYIWAASLSFVTFPFRFGKRRRDMWVFLITVGLILSTFRLGSMWYCGSGTSLARIIVHVTFGGLSALPALDFWYQPFGKGQDRGLFRSFLGLILINSLGGVFYATDLLDTPLGGYLSLADVSHGVMHIMTVYGAWTYQQGLMKAHHEEPSEKEGHCC